MIRLAAACLWVWTCAAVAAADDPTSRTESAPSESAAPSENAAPPLTPIPEAPGGAPGAAPAARPPAAPPSAFPPGGGVLPPGVWTPPGGMPPHAPGMQLPGSGLGQAPVPAVPFGAAGCYLPGTEIRYSAGNLAVPATTVGSFGYGGLGYAAMGYAPVLIVPYPYTGAMGGGLHRRFPYYSYRRPWYYDGPASMNVNIDW